MCVNFLLMLLVIICIAVDLGKVRLRSPGTLAVKTNIGSWWWR